MDIGNLKNNHFFYEGYEGEPEIILAVAQADEYNIHLWDGYFDDIFGDPVLDGNGWKGFTRDLNQIEGIFRGDQKSIEIKTAEYLEDALSYRGKSFRYAESPAALALLIDFLQHAIENNLTVTGRLG